MLRRENLYENHTMKQYTAMRMTSNFIKQQYKWISQIKHWMKESVTKNILYDPIYVKYKIQGKLSMFLKFPTPWKEGVKTGREKKQDFQSCCSYFISWPRCWLHRCFQLVKIHWAVLSYSITFYFNKNSLKCHYTRPHFLHPGKNRAICLEFLLQISIYPKPEQDHIRSLQELSNYLIWLLLTSATSKG